MTKSKYQIMIIIFLILIGAFAVLAVFFVVKNDFAEETIEILFPAVGAIVFSLYLGINTIYIKKPDAKRIETSIGILLNSSKGELYSLTNVRNTEDILEFQNYKKSIGNIDTYLNKFKDSLQL